MDVDLEKKGESCQDGIRGVKFMFYERPNYLNIQNVVPPPATFENQFFFSRSDCKYHPFLNINAIFLHKIDPE